MRSCKSFLQLNDGGFRVPPENSVSIGRSSHPQAGLPFFAFSKTHQALSESEPGRRIIGIKLDSFSQVGDGAVRISEVELDFGKSVNNL